ncbi:MAG: hypothetical protein FWG64_09510 [Firmicutes bacterium]|nr:hypothetical protein [Bacillota bacterium]
MDLEKIENEILEIVETVEKVEKVETVEKVENLTEIEQNIEQMNETVKSIAEHQAQTFAEVKEIHKLYHNNFARQIKNMQEEIEKYREIESNRIFDGILTEFAKFYNDNTKLLETLANEVSKANFTYMFDELLQILEVYGVLPFKSEIGDKRNVKYCKIIKKIPTEDATLHDTIAKSCNTAFYAENRTLVRENVEIYIKNTENTEN